MDLHLVVAAAVPGVEAGLVDDVFHPVVGPAAAAVRLHPIRRRAPHAEQRLAGHLAGQVPERDVQRGHRIAGQSNAPDAAIGAEHLLPQAGDQPRVLADQQWLEPGLEIDLDRLGSAAPEGQRVAEALHALVGVDEGGHHPVVLELQRHGLGAGHVEHHGLDAGDFHGCYPTAHDDFTPAPRAGVRRRPPQVEGPLRARPRGHAQRRRPRRTRLRAVPVLRGPRAGRAQVGRGRPRVHRLLERPRRPHARPQPPGGGEGHHRAGGQGPALQRVLGAGAALGRADPLDRAGRRARALHADRHRDDLAGGARGPRPSPGATTSSSSRATSTACTTCSWPR